VNYIKQLQTNVLVEQSGVAAYEAGLQEIRKYLSSDKFAYDTTVQVSDVLRMLEDTKRGVRDAMEMTEIQLSDAFEHEEQERLRAKKAKIDSSY